MITKCCRQNWPWVLLLIIILFLIVNWGGTPTPPPAAREDTVAPVAPVAPAAPAASKKAPRVIKPFVQKNVRAKDVNVAAPSVARVEAPEVIEEVVME